MLKALEFPSLSQLLRRSSTNPDALTPGRNVLAYSRLSRMMLLPYTHRAKRQRGSCEPCQAHPVASVLAITRVAISWAATAGVFSLCGCCAAECRNRVALIMRLAASRLVLSSSLGLFTHWSPLRTSLLARSTQSAPHCRNKLTSSIPSGPPTPLIFSGAQHMRVRKSNGQNEELLAHQLCSRNEGQELGCHLQRCRKEHHPLLSCFARLMHWYRACR